MKKKVPCCSVCQTRYNEEERVPLLLECGHSFCKECLSKMFSSSPKTTLSCPKCRHLSLIGNSVQSLRKNFAILSLLNTTTAFDSDFTENEDEDEEDNEAKDKFGCCGSGSGSGSVVGLAAQHELRLVKRIGEGRKVGDEMWSGVLSGGTCRHSVAVKRVKVGDEMDLVKVLSDLENLRRASLWCRNVCMVHGATRTDGYLCLVMDKYYGSIQSEMQRNEGRLTLEQILRYGADIARGLAELHAAGVVCMNLKPSNLLLDASGRAVVSDYGLPAILKKPSCRKAQSAPEDDSSRVHSCMDCTLLSPHYTAPEAWEPLKKSLRFWDDAIGISAESDAWSFGCTLVEMCTGSVPWAGLNSEEIYQAVVKARKQPPQYASVVGVGIPMELWKMIGDCLQFKPSKRPTFHTMLTIFLRHLKEIPRSPPASPDNFVTKDPGANSMQPPITSPSDVFQANPNLLHRLVSDGDLDGVRDLLARAASGYNSSLIGSLLKAQNADGQTALHMACRRGCVRMVEAILAYKEADVDILDNEGDPPIVLSLAAGSPECVRALIRRSADVRSRLREGFGPTVAHVCAYHGQPDCMRELLLAGADPSALDDEGETVLHRAIAKKYTDCAIVLLENGGSSSMGVLNSKNLTPLHMCIETRNVAVVRRWVEVASKEDIVGAIDIPSPDGTALCMAAALKKDHETEGRELVRILLAAGADPTAQATHCRPALHMAVMANDVSLVKIILDAGVDVNIRDMHNTIPLHVALANGGKLCVKLLLSAGANCNLQDDEGANAFHIAAGAAKMIRENLEFLVVMLQFPGADVEVRNHRGKTLRDFLEALPREWISEDLMEALMNKGIHLSPTIYEVGDWVKFRRSLETPTYGWQGARHKSVGFVQNVQEKDNLTVSFCSGKAHVLANEVIKVIALDRGQHVQLKADIKEPRYGWHNQSLDSIGTILCVDDDDGILRIGFTGASRGWKADPAEIERVEEFRVGDWVRIRPTLTAVKHGLGAVKPGSIGIVYCIRPDNSLLLDLCYLEFPWHCEPEEVEPVAPFSIGDQVSVKRSVAEPRYSWDGLTHHSVGRIAEIGSDGLLKIELPNRATKWNADPSEMDKVEDFKVGDWVRVKTSVSSPKYGWEDVTRNSVGIIHSLEEDGDMGVAFCFRYNPFCCSMTDMEKVQPFKQGQEIHVMPSVAQPRLGWSDETPATVGRISRIDMDGTLNVSVAGRVSLWKVSPGDAELLSGFEVGDWVRTKPSLGNRATYDWNGIGKDNLAVVHSVQDTGYLELACCFRKGRSMTHYTDVEKVVSLKIGQRVRFRAGLVEPRWGWRSAHPNSRGVIAGVHADGEVRVAFLGVSGLWRGDPADLSVEEMFEVGEWVRLRTNSSRWKSVEPGDIGIVQGMGYEGDEWDGSVLVAFCGEQEKWVGLVSQLERTDGFVVGQRVRVKLCVKQPRFCWLGHSHASVGTIAAIDADGKLRIYTPMGSKSWMLDPTEVEKVEEEELCIGDWVRVRASVATPTHQWGEVSHLSVGVVHRIEDGELWVSFCFMERLWICKAWEMERVRPFKVGDKIKIRGELVNPRWGWGMETHASKGEVVGVDANGKLRIQFRWREGKPWIGDPADIVLDESSSDPS